MTFSVAICDDSAPDRAAVQTLLAQWAAQRDLTVAPDIFASAEQFLFHYEDNPQYDLLPQYAEVGFYQAPGCGAHRL